MSSEIVVAPIGDIEPGIVPHVCEAVSQVFGRSVGVGKTLPTPAYAFNPRRAQYVAELIVERLAMETSARVLGIVDLDLYVPDLNFVFGLADRAGRRAVIALPRLRQSFYGARDDEALFLVRAVKEAVHELGHTCGLGHCSDRQCVMTFSNSLADTDRKGQQFCTRCAARLRW